MDLDLKDRSILCIGETGYNDWETIHNFLINTPGFEYFGSKDEALGNHQPSCVEDAWALALSTYR